jgi:hypothetical protein
VQLLAEDELKMQVSANTQSARSNAPVSIVSSLVYQTTMTKSNSFVSALVTNYYIVTGIHHENLHSFTDRIPSVYYEGDATYKRIINPIIPFSCKFCLFRCSLDSIFPSLVPIFTSKNGYHWSGPCNIDNPVFPVGFYTQAYDSYSYSNQYGKESVPFLHWNATAIVNGFFGSCYPFQALMFSTLDCLYDPHCLQSMSHYFPTMNTDWSESNLAGYSSNVSVERLLSNLFIDDWSTITDYSKYFAACAPSACTYKINNSNDLSHAITLIIGLYGGLVIVLRLVARSIVGIALQLRHRSVEMNPELGYARRCLAWLKQLNLFGSTTNRSAEKIAEQRTVTRLYLSLLAGKKS